MVPPCGWTVGSWKAGLQEQAGLPHGDTRMPDEALLRHRRPIIGPVPQASFFGKCGKRRENECRRQDLNLHWVLTQLGPQPSASANSATPASFLGR